MLRFALSPTGDMHIGNLRVALFNYILSKQLNEDLIIRIEDTDEQKNIEGKDKDILEILSLFSIDYTQVLYQSENLKQYSQMAIQLLNNKKELENTIVNQDKTPRYNFTCAVDDMLNNISTVIYEDDNLLNIEEQIHFRESLEYTQEINYIKLPIILELQSVESLINEGFLPAAIANYLILLGYNTPCKIFTVEEAIEWFDITKILKVPTKFDKEKLKSINCEYLKSIDDMRLSKLLGYADTDLGKLAKIYLQQSYTLKDLKLKVDGIFVKHETLEDFELEFLKLKDCLKIAPYIEDFNDFIKYTVEQSGLNGKQLTTPLRFILTGSIEGPELSEIYPLIKNYLGEII